MCRLFKGRYLYEVMEVMSQKGWSLSGLHKPPSVHICLTLRHTEEGVAQKFIEDLKEAVTYVKENPSFTKGMAPVYGMGATLPLRGVISDMLIKYMDTPYEI
jgi:sphinganine-1-phosphate aldolase